MAYTPRFVTRAELLARKGGVERVHRLAAPAKPSVDERIDAAHRAAEDEATSYLLGRYGADLPTTAAGTPEILKDVLADAFLWHLARANNDQVAPELRTGYEDALAWYNRVARGVASLDLAAAPAVDDTTAQVLTLKTRSDQVFANGGLNDW